VPVFHNAKAQDIKTFMPVVLNGCKTLPLILTEEFIIQVFKIKQQVIHLHPQNITYNDNLGYLIKRESEISNATLSWACD
jgi:hypothetical protein